MSKKMILGATALAMTIGLAAIPLQASAYDRLFSKVHELDADKDGMISIPQKPGLGVELDMEKIKACGVKV